MKQLIFVLIFITTLTGLQAWPQTPSQTYTVEQLIEYLDLEGHVEGGFYRRTYEAKDTPRVATESGKRFSMTSIFYLLSAESPVGHFHLNKSDIVHYFHLGDSVTYYLIDSQGNLNTAVLGSNLIAGEQLQLTVPGGVWKASKISDGHSQGYSLISEAVSPGFDFADMTLGDQKLLLERFPQHKNLILELCHKSAPKKP
ncbi:MAG: cupin domain-containing protein [Acidiferrobacterales bacterium]|nr:cupin domain-containing protein [Acidiferrobacterales bacterium]